MIMRIKVWLSSVGIFAVATLPFSSPAKNLLLNGKFEADQVDVPTYWRSSDVEGAPKILSCRPSGGPDGIPSVRFFNAPGGKPQSTSLRQYDLTLVKGGRYRISAWVRTKDLVAKRFGILAVNARWRGSVGINAVERTMDWRRLESEVEMMDSLDGRYSLTIFAQRFTGEFEIADLSLEPLSDDARAGSKPSSASTAMLLPRFFPWKPLLSEIPAETRQATFRFCGELPAGASVGDCTAVLTVEGTQQTVRLPLSEYVTFSLPADCPTAGMIRVSVLGKDGTAILENRYRYKMKPALKVSGAGHRRLNNFVTEVLNAPVEDESAELRFTTLRDGWVYMRIEGAACSCCVSLVSRLSSLV